jgi:hypothetical protein
MRFGIQLFPSCTAPQLVSYTKRALSQHPFDTVWLRDHLSYENVFVSLAPLITEIEADVGTSCFSAVARRVWNFLKACERVENLLPIAAEVQFATPALSLRRL